MVKLGSLRSTATLWERLLGLTGRSEEEIGGGLLILSCRSVHTFGMRVPIDVVFVDPLRRITRVYHRLPPRRLVWGGRQCKDVIELPPGAAKQLNLNPGMLVEWNEG